MARLNAQEWQEKHARRLKASLQDIRAGVAKVTEAPGAAAAAKADKMLAAITEAITSGRWAEAVGGVSLADWKTAMAGIGVDRISAGIDAASSKNVQMAGRLLSAIDAVATTVNAMPDNNLEDSLARMVAFSRGMAARKGTI